ncbi:MAG: hypothetical protein WHT28_00805 [Fimbriimonadales bacterium]|jgi:hypothetical protein|nr:hypothetical protein GXSOP10_1352 [Armatimonadetes bacterium GXS]
MTLRSQLLDALRFYYLHQYQAVVDSVSALDTGDAELSIALRILQAKAHYCLCRKGAAYSLLASLIRQYGYCEKTLTATSLLARLFPTHPYSRNWVEWLVQFAPEMSESHAAYITVLSYNNRKGEIEKHFRQFYSNLNHYDKEYCSLIVSASLAEHEQVRNRSKELLVSSADPVDFTRAFFLFALSSYNLLNSKIDETVLAAESLLNDLSPISNIDRARAHLALARLCSLYAADVPKTIDNLKKAVESGLYEHPYVWWVLGMLCSARWRDVDTAILALERFLSLMSGSVRGVYDIFTESVHNVYEMYAHFSLAFCYINKFNMIKSAKNLLKSLSKLKAYAESDLDAEYSRYFRVRGFFDFEVP